MFTSLQIEAQEPIMIKLVTDRGITNASMKKELLNILLILGTSRVHRPQNEQYLRNLIKPGVQVQLFSILAMTSRTMGDSFYAKTMEDHAKTLARATYDQISVDSSALGFFSLTVCWALIERHRPTIETLLSQW